MEGRPLAHVVEPFLSIGTLGWQGRKDDQDDSRWLACHATRTEKTLAIHGEDVRSSILKPWKRMQSSRGEQQAGRRIYNRYLGSAVHGAGHCYIYRVAVCFGGGAAPPVVGNPMKTLKLS